MKISIRIAGLNDSASIAELSGQLGYKAEENTTKERLSDILDHDDHTVFVAMENGKIIGWIHGFYSRRVESDPFVEIGGLVVHESYRKNGIGNALVEKIIQWCQVKKSSMVRVRCNVLRTDTHLFYQKIGFEINKEQKVFDKRLK